MITIKQLCFILKIVDLTYYKITKYFKMSSKMLLYVKFYDKI